jgi:hypothetical protein
MIGLEFLRIITMLNIIYRLCENETDGNIRDIRPPWYDKIKCLQSFLDTVKYSEQYVYSVTFVHDGPEGPLLNYINKSGWGHRVDKIYYKDNLKSLLSTLDVAEKLDGDIYFVEDDYLHKLNSIEKIAKAVKNLGLVNGYDHLDRYTRTDDAPYDLKIVFDNDSNTHWRTAESTCCTWAATADVYQQIKSDVKSFGLWDRELFRHLHRRGIPLWTAIPGLTSQIDRNMSPGVDWKEINERY